MGIFLILYVVSLKNSLAFSFKLSLYLISIEPFSVLAYSNKMKSASFMLMLFCVYTTVFCSPHSRPPPKEKAAMARYLVHKSDWCVIGTISTMKGQEGAPFTNIVSMSDGPVDNSTGVPYFYVTDLDQSSVDIKSNNTVSISMSDSETGYCEKLHLDPESPVCTRLTMTGKFVKVTDPDEVNFAEHALFSRHPVMKSWSTAHSFYPAKLQLDLIWLIDFYGGAAIIDPKEYYKAKL